MKTIKDYYLEVEAAQEELREAEGRLNDAEYEHDKTDKRLATAEHQLEEFIQRRDHLNPETGLPEECIPLVATSAREVLFYNHLIRVSPSHANRERWLLVITTSRGEVMIQQWSRENHRTWVGAVREAIDVGGFDR